jgi:hypothetical protein
VPVTAGIQSLATLRQARPRAVQPRDRTANFRLGPLLTASLVVAIAGPALSTFADSGVATHISMFTSASLWSILLVAALVLHGKRGLWLLVGAPFGLFIPLVWADLYFVCGCSIFQEG